MSLVQRFRTRVSGFLRGERFFSRSTVMRVPHAANQGVIRSAVNHAFITPDTSAVNAPEIRFRRAVPFWVLQKPLFVFIGFRSWGRLSSLFAPACCLQNLKRIPSAKLPCRSISLGQIWNRAFRFRTVLVHIRTAVLCRSDLFQKICTKFP